MKTSLMCSGHFRHAPLDFKAHDPCAHVRDQSFTPLTFTPWPLELAVAAIQLVTTCIKLNEWQMIKLLTCTRNNSTLVFLLLIPQ